MNILTPVLITALVSALFGSVSAAVFSHLLTSFRADKEYRLRKLEELYLTVESAGRNLRISFHYWAEVAGGVMLWIDAVDRGQVPLLDFQREHSTAMMIANIYFPDLAHIVDRLAQLARDVDGKVNAFRVVQIDGMQFPSYESEFSAAAEEMKKRQQEACEKIIDASQEVRRGRLFGRLRARFV
jgi:hypothetical protein